MWRLSLCVAGRPIPAGRWRMVPGGGSEPPTPGWGPSCALALLLGCPGAGLGSVTNRAVVSSLCTSRAGGKLEGEQNVSGMGDRFCTLVTCGHLYWYRQQRVTLHTHYSWWIHLLGRHYRGGWERKCSVKSIHISTLLLYLYPPSSVCL